MNLRSLAVNCAGISMVFLTVCVGTQRVHPTINSRPPRKAETFGQLIGDLKGEVLDEAADIYLGQWAGAHVHPDRLIAGFNKLPKREQLKFLVYRLATIPQPDGEAAWTMAALVRAYESGGQRLERDIAAFPVERLKSFCEFVGKWEVFQENRRTFASKPDPVQG